MITVAGGWGGGGGGGGIKVHGSKDMGVGVGVGESTLMKEMDCNKQLTRTYLMQWHTPTLNSYCGTQQ